MIRSSRMFQYCPVWKNRGICCGVPLEGGYCRDTWCLSFPEKAGCNRQPGWRAGFVRFGWTRFPCVSALWGISGNEWPAGVGGMRETGFCRDEGRPAGRVEESHRFFMQVRAGRGVSVSVPAGRNGGISGNLHLLAGLVGGAGLFVVFSNLKKFFPVFVGKPPAFSPCR